MPFNEEFDIGDGGTADADISQDDIEYLHTLD